MAIHHTHRSRRRRLLGGLVTLGLCMLWSLIILYPNPTLLPRAIANASDPQIDPEAVRDLANQLPDDPAYIERQIESDLVPYSVPWEMYGVPWYYPTTREVMEKGAADCQGRMLVFASILEAKGIPYQIRASLDHIWVEYEHKSENRLENAAIAVVNNGSLQVPASWDWRETYRIEKEYFWDPAPLSRKLLLFGGLAAIVMRRRITSVVRRRWNHVVPAGSSAVDQLHSSIGVWEAEGRLSPAESAQLRAELESAGVTNVASHLSAHIAMGLLLPFPFASLGRAGWTLWMLFRALLLRLTRRIERTTWQMAWRVHHPIVALVGAMPVIGSLGYLFAPALRGNWLLIRVAVDAMLSRMPWRLYERSQTRRLLTYGRPAVVNWPQSLSRE